MRMLLACWYHANLCERAFEKIPLKTGFARAWFQPQKSKILKCETAKHINKWMLDYDIPEHKECDANEQPALKFLRKNYPAEVCQRILDRIADAKRKSPLCFASPASHLFRKKES